MAFLLALLLVSGCEGTDFAPPSTGASVSATTSTTLAGSVVTSTTSVVTTAAVSPARPAKTMTKKAPVAKGRMARVTQVVDGDTIEVEMSGRRYRVRYIGIDTPETKHPRIGVECFGKEASQANRRLVEGKTVHLEKDVSDTDRYGRLLRYVWVGEVMVNDRLVLKGFAVSSSYPPDVKHQERFRASERAASKIDAGLWGSCGGADAPAAPSRSTRSDEPPTRPVGSKRFSSPACAKSDCDCADFGGDSSWATWFLREHDPGNSHRLDGDRDGTACE